MGEAPAREEGTVTRSAEYIGSFPVDDRCLDDQIELLHKHLKSLKRCKRSRPVCLKFSIKGVKMYDEDEATLLMAHALRRVSLSTARPADAQFAFVSHNPGSIEVQLYCHVFKARHARAAQFLNLLLCRCFQLSYLEKHPEEAQEYSASPAPQRNPSLLNHGFPLSVSALVSFRRAPFRGLFPGTKKHEKPNDESPASHDEVFTSSPSLVRKKAIRTKGLRSGAYRSFTFTPLKQRRVQERLGASQEKDLNKVPVTRSRAPSLAETEEALAQAVWCWDGIAADSSYSLLADDVLGSYFLCLNPKKQSKCGTLIVRFPSGLITHLIGNTRKGKFVLEKCKTEFDSIAELLEHYSQTQDGLPCLLSCTRVNHCYEWEENSSKPTVMTRSNQGKLKSTRKREPLNI